MVKNDGMLVLVQISVLGMAGKAAETMGVNMVVDLADLREMPAGGLYGWANTAAEALAPTIDRSMSLEEAEIYVRDILASRRGHKSMVKLDPKTLDKVQVY